MTTKELLQVVVRPRQIRHLITVKQTRPITPAHFPEMLHRRSQLADLFLVARHRPQESTQATPHSRGCVTGLVAQQVRCLVDPTEGDVDLRPQLGGGRQSTID